MAPHELADRRRGDAHPARHPQPGGGDVDVEDAHGLALQVVGRRKRQSRDNADGSERQPDQQQPGRGRPGEAEEPRGIGEGMHRRGRLKDKGPYPNPSPAGGRGRSGAAEEGEGLHLLTYPLPISLCAIASATAAGSRPSASLSAQICSSRIGMPSMRLRTRLASPSPRYSVQTLMMPPALMT